MVEKTTDFERILAAYDVFPLPEPRHFGSGHINATFLVEGEDGRKFVLQRINSAVFQIEAIAHNLRLAAKYLTKHHPDYLFVAPIPTLAGEEMVVLEGESWRLTPFVPNSTSINEATTPQQAYEAARQFGLLSKNLDGLDLAKFEATIPDFHNLSFRFGQFQDAIAAAPESRREAAVELVAYFLDKSEIVATYESLMQNPDFPDRLMHHDTKINNVLLDADTQRGLAVCDLDTLMPGKVISDLGDMVRTYVSPVSEESVEFEKVVVREEYYKALIEGYLSEMKGVLTETEKSAIFYSGLFLVYMQGIRFLADYLNGDVYYPVKYPEHNLDRAKNQMVLLQDLYRTEDRLREIISEALSQE
ncbi:phosphotransferase enzyme family protein [Persicitalea jodogahamensis]|uniref:Mucin desulfatase n=1 Tax=Persicitalea jodogahamensis TaxID=402147 RepID=A0A8J3D3A6_9BACT|nr:aminoglycoside phosphotransferase family protein [Persicitalea jodogahamensis]GHB75621.1 mucin desulfatase [Persicitalea jodogahamensis]